MHFECVRKKKIDYQGMDNFKKFKLIFKTSTCIKNFTKQKFFKCHSLAFYKTTIVQAVDAAKRPQKKL